MEYTAEKFWLSATDLSNHPGCRVLTQLNMKAALGDLKRPFRNDPSLEILQQRGRDHEAAFVKHLKTKGLNVVRLKTQSADETLTLMREGTDVIVQARLENGPWMGYADVLVKIPGKSKFGDWSYEVYDTKLAQQTKASSILQLCLYTDLLSEMQESIPLRMHIVKPDADFVSEEYSFADFQAYYRIIKKNLANTISLPAVDLYPKPVAHCEYCNWWTLCDKRRHDDDYLSLVAGIRTQQIEELEQQHILTLEAFANAEALAVPQRGDKDSFLRRQAQAKIQFQGRVQGKLLYELLPVEEKRGFNNLPAPNAGDVYFDFEGDPFFPGGGLEYLLGFITRDEQLVYTKYWATNRAEEKKLFIAFMEMVVDRLKKFPKLHLYHFAPYEPAAIKRLAMTHAIFESEVDELLRADKFVDLHAIFKQAMLASVERYSLKDLEKFTEYVRKVELRDASAARKNVECAVELNEFASLAEETRRTVEDYNEDDCMATEALHLWLEKIRESLISQGSSFTRPIPGEPESAEKLKELEIRSKALYTSLIQGLPDDPTQRTNEDQAKWLLAHLVDYFRREDKNAWWEHFRVHTMEAEDLLEERKALTGLTFIETLPAKNAKELPVHRYHYPRQEVGLTKGDLLIEVNSQSEVFKIGREIGTVESISAEKQIIDIKKRGAAADVHPVSVHAYDRIDPKSLWVSLMNLAQAIDDGGLAHTWPFHASKDLLMKRNPRLLDGTEGAYLLPGEPVITGAIRIALNLDRSILAIQGPPGTGKTHTGAEMIKALVKAGKKVGVTAISHKTIFTLFEKVYALDDKENRIAFVHKVSEKKPDVPEWIVQLKEIPKVVDALQTGKVAGGTAWLWADDKMTDTLDYLFIDEAGQMSLSQALAASRAAKNLIFLGDPQQLEQPQRGSHPEGSDIAALTFLLEGSQTMPPGRGLFLDVTRRIHPAISRYTSELFYDGKLKSLPGLEKQIISGGTPFDGAGLFHVPVEHSGNGNNSADEVNAIAKIVTKLLAQGKWTNAEGQTRTLKPEDILIVAPYNAQVAALIQNIPSLQIGTVDKFQGKEAPVVIYSMTASTVGDAPRGMGFLFNPNRLNVATSRAKSVCILVSSTNLSEPECNSIDQMRWANGICRYLELATTVEAARL